MQLQDIFGQTQLAPTSSWLSADSIPLRTDMTSTGGNSAGDGGNGYFLGSMVHASFLLYMPINIAVAGHNSTADAHQSNILQLDQSTIQIAGLGGAGGDGNAALGGNLGLHGPSGFGMIATGDNGAGNGGNGNFYGALSHAPAAIFEPTNTAITGTRGKAEASQMNIGYFDQAATQIAGIGGDGGYHNHALGGDLEILAAHALLDHPDHAFLDHS